jgi:Zn-dependent protease
MPTYYEVDLRNAQRKEFAFGVPWHRMPLIALMKFLGARFQGTTDDPPVESLIPFEVGPETLPPVLQVLFAPLAEELASLGFQPLLHHDIPYPRHATHSHWATFLHSSGKAWARIHCRIWTGEGPERIFLFPMFFSALDDGSFFVSSAGKQDMLMPEGVTMVNQVGASATELWDRHNQELASLHLRQPIRVGSVEQLRELMEQHHGKLRDFNLNRGVFLPLSEQEQQQTQAQVDPEVTNTAPPEDIAVFAELERLQGDTSSKRSGALILLISMAMFAAAARVGEDWRFMLSLIPILLFHELGHYVAMRWFGYRNLKMFFIPFLGAAVTGRNYNVAGWKKAVVALMGPLPGIFLGAALGYAGQEFKIPWMTEAAVLLLILNGFNLLPLLPLDGGWVVHAVLFARHPVLDVVFRVIAIVGLTALWWWAGSIFLLILPGFMLMGLSMAWQIANVARRLRNQGFAATSPDAHTIPPETAAGILTEIRTSLPQVKAPVLQAQYVLQVFETLNARPPGVLASLGLLLLQGVSFVGSVVLTVWFMLHMQFPFWMKEEHFPPPPPPPPPQYQFAPGQTQVWRGPAAPVPKVQAQVTIIANYPSVAAAQEAFARLPAQLPPQATLRWFGQTLLLTLPMDQKEAQQRWTEQLQRDAPKVIVDSKGMGVAVRLYCHVADEESGKKMEEEIRPYLHAPNQALLVPPWSVAWEKLPAAQREQYQKARRTLSRLQNLANEANQQPAVKAISDQIIAAVGQKNPKNPQQMQELIHAFGETVKAEKKRLFDQLKAEDEKTIDKPLLALWEQWEKLQGNMDAAIEEPEPAPPKKPKPDQEMTKEEKAQARMAAFLRKQDILKKRMAVRMGALPLEGDKPRPGSDLDAGSVGAMVRIDLALRFEYLLLPHPQQGLPTLAEWLCKRGCQQLRYELVGPAGGDEDEGDNGP